MKKTGTILLTLLGFMGFFWMGLGLVKIPLTPMGTTPNPHIPLACDPANKGTFDELGFFMIQKQCLALESINKDYQAKIRPLLQAQCALCHGHPQEMPFYAILPGLNHFLGANPAKAKLEFDITTDYPFGGEDFPLKMFEKLTINLQQGHHPPLLSQSLWHKPHLSPQEKEKIQQWVQESINKLQ